MLLLYFVDIWYKVNSINAFVIYMLTSRISPHVDIRNISLKQGSVFRDMVIQIQIQKSQYPLQLRCLFYLVMLGWEGGWFRQQCNLILCYVDSNAIFTCLPLKFVSPILGCGLNKPQRSPCQQGKRQHRYGSQGMAIQESEANQSSRVAASCSSNQVQKSARTRRTKPCEGLVT